MSPKCPKTVQIYPKLDNLNVKKCKNYNDRGVFFIFHFTAVTINTQPIVLCFWQSNLSLVEANQRKPLALFFILRPDFEQFFQKETIKALKQPNSESITVLKRGLIQYDKRLPLRAAAAA